MKFFENVKQVFESNDPIGKTKFRKQFVNLFVKKKHFCEEDNVFLL